MLELRAIGLNMVETNTYNEVFPANILDKYTFMETGSASKIAEAVCPLELNDIIEVLNDFVLSSRLLLTKGGNRGPIPIILDGAFSDRGWIEARIDLYKRAFIFQGQNAPTVAEDPLGENANNHLVSETYQQGYSVDNVKGRIALDVEWNPKDGNLDRDFSAYRAWHNEGRDCGRFPVHPTPAGVETRGTRRESSTPAPARSSPSGTTASRSPGPP